MKIGLSVLHALPEVTGAWNYIARLMRALAQHADEQQFIVFATDVSAPLVPNARQFELQLFPFDPRSRVSRIWCEHTSLFRCGRRSGIQVMHHFSGTMPVVSAWANVVTIYDLLVYRDASAFSWAKTAYLRRMIPIAVRRADVVAPMSKSTAADVIRRFHVSEDRMAVVPALLDDAFRPAPPAKVAQFRARYGLPEVFWLYVSHLHPHKNHEALLRAFAEDEDLPGPVWPLVLRGDGTERLLEAIGSLGLERRVHLLPPLDAAEMPLLYSAAGGLVFPSLFEGGGIPVLEAMASGCPVVASDIPTTREFGGDAVLLFPPTDVAAMRSALHRVEASPQLRDSLRQRGLGQAARSGSGSTIARACLTAYAAAWQGYSANASRRLGGAVARR